MAVGTNAFDSLTLDKGTRAAEFGSARGSIVELESRRAAPEGGRHLSVSGGWATDAVFGTGNGLNLNLLTLAVDGQAGCFSANIAAVGEGQGSERLGLDQNALPVYVADGLDTVVTVNKVGGGTTAVDVLKFTPSPGIRIPPAPRPTTPSSTAPATSSASTSDSNSQPSEASSSPESSTTGASTIPRTWARPVTGIGW